MSRFVVGIDLGTTNSALAYADTAEATPDAPATIRALGIPQVVGVNEVGERPVLPSFLYLAAPKEFPAGGLDLPWKAPADRVVGTFARDQGAKVPGRLVSSAKSWLSHAGVDRRSPLLPWKRPEAEPRVSPVEATSAYLAHLRDAWNAAIAGQDRRRSARGAGRAPDRPGLVRRRGPRADRGGGPGGGAGAGHAPGGTAGRLLRLAGRPGRLLAQGGPGRRHHPRLRRGRGDDRLHPHRRDRPGGRPDPDEAGRRRAHPARRRQHGPRAGACRRGHPPRGPRGARPRRSEWRSATPAGRPRRRSSASPPRRRPRSRSWGGARRSSAARSRPS